MKKFSLFVSIIVATFCISCQAFATPVYTDEIPQEYINKVRAQKNQTNYETRMMQDVSDFEKETLTEVKVYTPENIRFKLKTRKIDINTYRMEATNVKVGDKFKFLVAEDVYKNGKLYIKKGTPTVGYVKKIALPSGINGPVPEFRITGFTIKDIDNKTVMLKGSVVNDYTGFIQLVSHGINKNKIYKLYLK